MVEPSDASMSSSSSQSASSSSSSPAAATTSFSSLALSTLSPSWTLYRAVLEDRLDIVNLWLDHGVWVNARDYGRCYAAASGTPTSCGCTTTTATTSETSLSYSYSMWAGDTMLHCAAQYGSPRMVRTLIRRGADLLARDYSGQTPLHRAIQYGRYDIAQALLQQARRQPPQQQQRMTTRTTRRRRSTLPPIRQLSQPPHEEMKQWPCTRVDGLPLNSSSGGNSTNRASSTIAALLVRRPTKDGRTALHYAVHNGHPQMIESLVIQHNACPYIQDQRGDTPLHVMARTGGYRGDSDSSHVDHIHRIATGRRLVRLLLQYHGGQTGKAFLQDKGRGYTPLHCAVLFRHIHIVQELLLWYDRERQNHRQSSRTTATTTTNTNGPPTLGEPTRSSVIPLADHDVDNDVDSVVINGRDRAGNTPLHLAVKYWSGGQSRRGASNLAAVATTTTSSDHDQQQHLTRTTTEKSIELVQLLLDHGARVDVFNRHQWTPLHHAARQSNWVLMQVLLDQASLQGCDWLLHAPNLSRETPFTLFVSRSTRFDDIYELLHRSFAGV